jgi:hypothetical protein
MDPAEALSSALSEQRLALRLFVMESIRLRYR